MEIETVLFKKKPRKRKKLRISKLTGKPIISRQKAERLLWEAFSQYIRKRDKTCVLAHLGGCSAILQAGHVIPRTKHAVKYDEGNVFGQCSSHNYLHSQQRTAYIYIDWFLENRGLQEWNRLNDLIKENPENKSISKEEAQRLTKYYQEQIKNL